jgi:hypothetical protein
MRDELEDGEEEYANMMEAAIARLEDKPPWHKSVLGELLEVVKHFLR